VRLFIAIPIEDKIKEAISEFQSKLNKKLMGQADVKMVHSDNIHLTLRFLGEINEEQLPAITNSMQKAIEGKYAFEAEIKTLGAFPTITSPRVIWVGYKEANNTNYTKQIYDVMEKGLRENNFTPDDHASSPHITIARVKSPRGKEKLANLLKENTDLYAGKQIVKEITLFRSELRRDGPIYSIVNNFILL
jgi:2'-5' RNA ligase